MSKYVYEKFYIEEPADAGIPVFESDNSKAEFDGKQLHFKQVMSTPTGIYLFAVAVFLVFWYLYSFIAAAVNYENWVRLAELIPSFFLLAVIELILFVTMFGLWGKLARFALRTNTVHREDRRRIEAQVEEADRNADKKYALYIYKKYINIINYGKSRWLNRNVIKRVTLQKAGSAYRTAIYSIRGEWEYSNADIKKEEVYKLKEIFGDLLEVEKPRKVKREKFKEYDYVDKYESEPNALKETFTGNHLAGLIMGFIAAAVGVVVIMLHFKINQQIPWGIGAFFVGGGVLVMFTAFDSFALVKIFLIPCLFGAFFIVGPVFLLIAIYGDTGTPLPISSLHEFLSSFSPIFAGMCFFMSIGVLIFISALTQLIKYIKYRV
ncbi:MAG: hypothetical protein HDP34_01815 [Clostridia bacterium]|nr:hypothetical protein [Clostridia bacterium]